MSFKFNPFSGGLDSTNPSGYLGGDLEVTGKLTVTQTISSPTFDSSKVDSTYTTVNANSASWGTGGSGIGADTAVRSLTGKYESSYTTLNTNSASWNSSLTTVRSNSAQWATNGDSSVRTLTGKYESTYTTVNTNSALWGGGSGVNLSEVAAVSANWNSSYTTVSNTSANWNTAYSKTTTLGSAATANIGTQAENVAAGNHIHTVYGDIQQAITDDSATAFSDLVGALGIPNNYINDGKLAGLDSIGTGALYAVSAFASSSIYQDLTGNWNSTYTTVNANSASWGAGGSSVNISEVAAASASWNSTNTTVNANSGTWNRATSAAMLRMVISGTAGLTNTTNSTDFIIPFNTLQYMTDSNVISGSVVSDNILIREPGLYQISVRYASFDMTNANNFMRIQLRSSTSGVITNATGGTLFRAMEQGVIGTSLNGEATKQGSDFIIITNTPTWIVATALHSGAIGGNGNQGYPVNDNSFGNQPQLTVMKVRDL